jgi:hypothetical protein
MRRLLSLAVAASLAGAGAAVGLVSPVHASVASSQGGCSLAGTASITPGLTTHKHAFTYTFTGKLSSCHSSSEPKITSGTTTASGKGSGSCASGTTSGTGTVTWNTKQKSSIKFTTTSMGNSLTLKGTVAKGVFKGDSVTGQLAFKANPTQCNSKAGAKKLAFNGAVTLH